MQLILQDQLKPETLVCYPKSNITHIYWLQESMAYQGTPTD
jgi:hypothetical protein